MTNSQNAVVDSPSNPLTRRPSDFSAIESLNDEAIRQVVGKAELAPLLVTLAQITGDMTLLDPRLRPPLHPSPTEMEKQGGMSPENQEIARDRAIRALQKLRDDGGKIRPVATRDEFYQMMTFITGEGTEDYLPLLLNELQVEPIDAPAESRWTKKELAPERPFSVAIIGAGMSGIAAAFRLDEAGIDYTIFEKNDEVGGTWLENDYPGCRLDTNNFAYTYSFAQSAGWKQHYTLRDPIHEYFRNIAETTGISERIRFGTEVVSARFEESSMDWSLEVRETSGATRSVRVDAVISAVGQLNRPKIPSIAGRETFLGKSWHSAQWDHSVPLEKLRVGVIGTGASAYQIVPEIAEQVGELKVFQRTPPWMLPTSDYHEEIDEQLLWMIREMPYLDRWLRFYQFWIAVEGRRRFVEIDPEWHENGSVSSLNAQMRRGLIGRLEEQLEDRPDLLEKMIPAYPPGSKRMLRDNGVWSAALKRHNVDLVTENIREIVPSGIVTEDGERHDLDVIVYATGFEASEFLAPMRIFGRNGSELREQWGNDPRAYLGITVPGFPNFFCLYGPNTALVVNGSAFFMSEAGVNYIVGCLKLLLAQGYAAMDCKWEPYLAYNGEIDRANEKMAWGVDGVESWYKGKTGRVTQVWPHSLLRYWELTRSPSAQDYELIVKDR